MCATGELRCQLLTFHSDLRASLSGKDIPEDVKNRLLKMHEDNIHLQEQYKTVQEKLTKARAVSFREVVVPARH